MKPAPLSRKSNQVRRSSEAVWEGGSLDKKPALTPSPPGTKALKRPVSAGPSTEADRATVDAALATVAQFKQAAPPPMDVPLLTAADLGPDLGGGFSAAMAAYSQSAKVGEPPNDSPDVVVAQLGAGFPKPQPSASNSSLLNSVDAGWLGASGPGSSQFSELFPPQP